MTFKVIPWCFMLNRIIQFVGFVVCSLKIHKEKLATPLKISMEPKHGGLEDDFPFQLGHFQIFSGSMLIFHGVPKWAGSTRESSRKWVFNSKAPPPATLPLLDGIAGNTLLGAANGRVWGP